MIFSEEMNAYLNGSAWPVERDKLVELANSSNGEFIIEVGILRGETTKYLLENTEKKVIAIDPFDTTIDINESIKQEFLNLCQEYIDEGRLFFIQQRSENAHRYLTPYLVKNCALIFIDWYADGEQHLKDFKEYIPYIAEDGFLAVHDFYDNGTFGKHNHISYAISEYMKFIDESICWQTILYYPKHSDVSECMLYYGESPDLFYANRTRGLIWCSPNS